MDPKIYSLLHVTSGFLLVALTFRAFAAPVPETRKRTLMLTGILSLVMLVGGFGLHAKLISPAFPGWLIVKIVCWLGLSALAGMVYRAPQKAGLFSWVAAVLVVTAIAMVYLRPF